MNREFKKLPTTNHIFFQWIANCCELLGRDRIEGAKMIEDQSWFNCYDDGLTPEQAVVEYCEKHPE